jgi:hypothetical protein
MTWCPRAVRELQLDLWPVPPSAETAGGFVGSVLCQAPSSDMHLTLCQRAVGCQLRERVDSYTRMGWGSRPSSSTTTQSRSDRSWLRHLLRHAQGRFSGSSCIVTDYNTVVKTIHVTQGTGDVITMGVTSAVWPPGCTHGSPPAAHREAVLAIR